MLNAIIDYINDRTEATERGIYRALRVVLRHCIAMCDEIEVLRYPPEPEPWTPVVITNPLETKPDPGMAPYWVSLASQSLDQ